jgi:hypothetical protein
MILKNKSVFGFACCCRLCYNPLQFLTARQENGMLLEDAKQELDKITSRIETLRRHL